MRRDRTKEAPQAMPQSCNVGEWSPHDALFPQPSLLMIYGLEEIRFFIPASVLIAGLLGGCASSKPPVPDPDVEEARGATWTLVPLVFPDTVVSGYEHVSRHKALRSELQEALRVAEQSFQTYDDTTEKGGVYAYDVYRRDEESGKLEPVYPALQSIRQASGRRYALTARATEWSRTAGQAVNEIGTSALSFFFPETVSHDALSEPYDFNNGTAVVLDLIDTWAGQIVGRGTARTKRGVEAGVRAALLELLTGRTLTPRSFEVDTSDDVIVYRYAEPNLIGASFRVDKMDAVVELQDGTVKRIPIHTVKKVKSTTSNRTIFPEG